MAATFHRARGLPLYLSPCWRYVIGRQAGGWTVSAAPGCPAAEQMLQAEGIGPARFATRRDALARVRVMCDVEQSARRPAGRASLDLRRRDGAWLLDGSTITMWQGFRGRWQIAGGAQEALPGWLTEAYWPSAAHARDALAVALAAR